MFTRYFNMDILGSCFVKGYILIILCLFHTALVIGQVTGPRLVASDFTGQGIPNPGGVVEGKATRLSCTYPTFNDIGAIKMSIKYAENATSWLLQVTCVLQANGDILKRNNTAIPGEDLAFTTENLTCSSSSMTVRLQMNESSPKYYRCTTDDFYGSTSHSDIILRTYSDPAIPVILKKVPSSTPLEGEAISYECSSKGRPPPNLKLSYPGSNIKSSELSHTPPKDTITVDSAYGPSTLIWTANATKYMNGQTLKCEIDAHPYGVTSESAEVMGVYYGPESVPAPVELTWNLFLDGESKTINCGLDFNGVVDYQWYTGSVDNDNKLPDTSSTLTIMKSSFSEVVGDEQITREYVCVGTNKDNKMKSAQLRTKVLVFTTEPIKSPGNERNTSEEATPLPTYAIVLIVVGVVAVLGIFVAAAWMGCRQRRNSPAMQKKQAANKKSKPTSYSNGRGESGPIGQPDIIRNSLRLDPPAVATLSSPDYRYSQHVEDYDIDDQPRSRKPIQINADEFNLGYDGPPYLENGPPGYNTNDSSMYRGYMDTTPRDNYNSMQRYGAPC